jgi:hypothetical protein
MATVSWEGARTEEPSPAVVLAQASLPDTPGWLLMSDTSSLRNVASVEVADCSRERTAV